MDSVFFSLLAVLVFLFVVIALSWLYFRRFQIIRPPVGVFNLTDIMFMIAGIILVPYLYLLLPIWLVAGLLLLSAASVIYFLWEPVIPARLLVWLVTLALICADIWAALQFGPNRNGFFIVNNIVLLAMVVGLSNLWAQSGMQARDVTILGGFLAFYDLIATWLLPLMNDMLLRLGGLPFSPVFCWVAGTGGSDGSFTWISIGMGDLLLASVFPLVMRKAFGRHAGQVAMLIVLVLTATITLLATALSTTFPLMVVLGPVMAVQYAYWMRKQKGERTTRQYLLIEPL